MEFTFIFAVFFALIFGIYIGKKIVEYYYKAKLKEWIWKREDEIREDAVKRSKSVLMGKFLEHISPFFPNFKYNPTDMRFIGNPIDFIVFRGLSKGKPKEIIFLEIKTGRNRLNKMETEIKMVVKNKKVRWEEYKPNK